VALASEREHTAPERSGRSRRELPAQRSPIAGVLALQRTAGNAATGRLLARTPRKPYQHQWENPALLETIYPERERVLKKFVSIFREVELRDLTDPKARQQVIDDWRKAIQSQIDALKGLSELSKQDKERIAALEAALKRSQASAAQAFEEAVNWEREHRADPLAGAALLAEVKRLFGTKGVPDWLESMVLDYAGMRYKSAHGSYFNPVRLLFIIERERVGLAGLLPRVTHWLVWKHQATVVRVMPDGRIITFETVIEKTGSAEHHMTGFGTRWLADLTQPGVFVGYMPGDVDAPPVAPAPAAVDPDDRLLEEIILGVIVGD
jgi:hypothetical protein